MSKAGKVLVIQHVAPETPGTIADALGLQLEVVRVFAGDPVPATLADASGLVVMGGPMSVYEQEKYPHLREELRLIEDALKRQQPVLGVCLGSQLLAAALGSPVTPGRKKEIGWYPIRLTPYAAQDKLWSEAPSQLTVFHWHGDVYPLPQSAVHLASSEQTPIQVFRYGTNAYGFLCHLEVNQTLIAGMQSAFAEELQQAGISSEQMKHETQLHLTALQNQSKVLWNRWAQLVMSL